MSRWYIDTSAAAKLVITEDESDALAHELDQQMPDLVACYLLETELRRIVHRVEDLTNESVTGLLDRIDLYEVPPSLFRAAGLLHGANVRSLDAIHVAASVQIGVDALLTYDPRMATAARAVGLPVVAPAPA